ERYSPDRSQPFVSLHLFHDFFTYLCFYLICLIFFFFNDPATTEIYTLSLHDALPIAVAAHYAPEGSLTINGGVPAVGRDAIVAVAASFYKALPDMQVYFDDLVVDGDRIEYHWTFTGTNTGPDGTGNAVRVKGFELWTIDED